MKQYRQFLKNMPTTFIVYAVEECSIPSYETDILVNATKKLSESNNCEYVILVCNESILSSDKKLQYLKLAYPNTNFLYTDNLAESISNLKANYKSAIPLPVTILESFTVTDRLVQYAEQGHYSDFKQYLPTSMRDIDGKRLMNDIRESFQLDPIKDILKIKVDSIREQYFNKEIFNIGDIVESNTVKYEILDRGSNYLVLIDKNGETSRKWIQDVTMSEDTQLFTNAQFDKEDSEVAPREISFKGYTTKNLHNATGASEAFVKTINNMGSIDPVSVLNALRATDYYLGVTVADIMHGGSEDQSDLLKWSDAHLKAKRALDKCGEFINHIEYWHLYKDELDKAVFAVKIKSNATPIQDFNESVMIDENKLKVVRMIASVIGLNESDCCNNPDDIVNSALIKAKTLPDSSKQIIDKMLKLADEVGIVYTKSGGKLTTEQVQLAMERAEHYGRRYPNPIDNGWVLSEGKAPSIVMDKSKVGQVAALRPDDEKKLTVMNNLGKGETVGTGIPPKTAKEIENYANTGYTDGIVRKRGQNQPEYTHVGASLTTDNDDTISRMKANKLRNESKECEDDEEVSEKEIDSMISGLSHDDYLEAYHPDEFGVVNAETGEEEKEEHKPVNEEALNEVLSTLERIKAKLRFSKNKTKVEYARMLALKKHSSSKQINKRARHMAVNLIKKKLLKGMAYGQLSTTEKSRIDKLVEARAKVIGRIALKLAPKIRKLEQTRLSHKSYTEEK